MDKEQKEKLEETIKNYEEATSNYHKAIKNYEEAADNYLEAAESYRNATCNYSKNFLGLGFGFWGGLSLFIVTCVGLGILLGELSS